MLVRRKRSNKRKRKFYKAVDFCYSPELSVEEISAFLGNLGRVSVIEENNIIYDIWIETVDGRKICPDQFLLKDDRRERILSFDSTIFYDFYDIWST